MGPSWEKRGGKEEGCGSGSKMLDVPFFFSVSEAPLIPRTGGFPRFVGFACSD